MNGSGLTRQGFNCLLTRGPSPMERRWGRQLWVESRPSWTQAGWWDAELSSSVRALLVIPLGPELVTRLLSLVGDPSGECQHPHPVALPEDRLGVAGSPCGCQVVLAAAWQAAASWTSLSADRAVLAAVGSEPVRVALRPGRSEWGSITDPAVEEMAVGLRCSPASMRNQIHRVRELSALPGLTAAVAEGLLIGWHAGLVAGDIAHLTLDNRTTVVDELLIRLRDRHVRGRTTWTFTEVRGCVRRIVARLDPDGRGRRRRCHFGRGVRLRSDGGGQASVIATLPEDLATRIYRRLTALALGLDPDDPDPGPGLGDSRDPADPGSGLGHPRDPADPRSLDQRRADVLTDLILHRPAGAGEPVGEVAVIVDLATVLGAADNPAGLPEGLPVPAEVAREIAADRSWRAWITGPDGTVVATSARTYRPSASLARLIRAREPHCRMPGCRNPRTDLDHTVPFPAGPTDHENLHALCRRHHRMKHGTRWRLTNHPDGYTWVTPAGISHHDSPHPPLRN